jgi:hypothetical protein
MPAPEMRMLRFDIGGDSHMAVLAEGGTQVPIRNELSAITMRRFNLERGTEAGRKEGGRTVYCVLK